MRKPTQQVITVSLSLALATMATAARAEDPLLACRKTVGREATRLLRKEASVLGRCQEKRLRTPSISCPTVADSAKLARARGRAHSGIERVCASGVPPEFLGQCASPCAIMITGETELADCVVCLADATTTGFVTVAFPGPPQPGAVCGDGVTGAGEECDAPDDSACPGRCGAPGGPDACRCQPPQSCTEVAQPPASCATGNHCPAGYACNLSLGQCEAGQCVARADCAAGGQCVHSGSAPDGTCVCRGCGAWDCIAGCTMGGIMSGCLCGSIDDCPPQDDVCFQGVCS